LVFIEEFIKIKPLLWQKPSQQILNNWVLNWKTSH